MLSRIRLLPLSGSMDGLTSSTFLLTGTAPTLPSPGLARVSPDGSTVVVTNRAGNSVSIIDAARLVVRSAINICIHPEDIAILLDSSKAFVSCSGSGQVASIALRNATQKENELQND